MSHVVNFETWPRYQHYKIFAGMDYPHLTVSFDMDIKPLLNSSKSMFSSILYVVHSTSESIPEFKYRIQNDGSVVHYEKMDISFNILAKDGLFSNHRMSPPKDFNLFHETVQRAVKLKSAKGVVVIDPNQDQDLIVTSFVPWFSFTSVREPIMNKNDSIPRITWGRYTSEGKLPVSIQAHHGLIDGYHLGQFHDLFKQKISDFSLM